MNCEYTPSGNKVVKPTQYPLVEHRGDCIVISSNVPSCVSISSKVPECISISSIKDEVCCEIPDIPTLSPDDPPVNDLYEANTEYIFTITNFDENAFYYLYTPAESGTTTIVNDKITWITPDYNENTDFKCFYVTVKNTCGNTSSLQYCQHIIPQKGRVIFTFETTEVNEVVNIVTISDVNDSWEMDWGDGTDKNHETTHTYVNIGTYVCKLDISQEAVLDLSYNTQLIEFSDFGLTELSRVTFNSCVNCNFTFQTNPNFSKSTSMSYMFNGCNFTNSTSTLNIGDWNIDNVTKFNFMFNLCVNTPDVDMSWFSGKIETSDSAFQNLNITVPTELNLKSISSFHHSSSFSGSTVNGLRTLNMIENTDYDTYVSDRFITSNMFSGATLDGDLVINTSIDSTYTFHYMFKGCVSNYSISFNNEVSSAYLSYMFSEANINTINITKIIPLNNISNYSNFNNMFSFSTIDSVNIQLILDGDDIRFNNMFSGAYINNIDFSTLNTINVTNMSYMFMSSNITNLDVSQFNVENVTDMNNMFTNCANFTSDLSQWRVDNVTNISGLFNGCTNFTSDLSQWSVNNVTNMSSMFQGCTNFTSDLSQWGTSNVTYMSSMFQGCTNFTSDLSGWDVSNVTNISYMFFNCSDFTSDLSGWDVSNVTNMEYTFYDCTSLTSDLSGWNVANVTSHNNFAYNCDISYTDDDGNQPYMPPFPT